MTDILKIESAILSYLIDEAGIEEDISPTDSLVEGKIIDSFDLVSLSIFLSEKFSVKIKPLDINLKNFDSVEKIATYISNKLA